MKKIFTILFAVFFSASAMASIEYYDFSSEGDEHRFKDLIAELRCPKCQNTNLAESNAPLAKDLKNKVYKMINEGKEDDQIIDFMVARYGDFVTYTPPFNALTWWLWLGPAAVFVIASAFAISWFRKQRPDEKAPVGVDKSKVDALLQKYEQEDE